MPVLPARSNRKLLPLAEEITTWPLETLATSPAACNVELELNAALNASAVVVAVELVVLVMVKADVPAPPPVEKTKSLVAATLNVPPDPVMLE